jgi:Ca-activated chloride channel family protein
VAARRAAARMVDSLTGRDRFAVLAFDNLIETPPEAGTGLLAADDHARSQAVEFLSHLEARGGTEMAAPLARALDLLTGVAMPEPRPPVPRPPTTPGTPDPHLPVPGPPNREGSPAAEGGSPVVHSPLADPPDDPGRRDPVLVLVTDGQVGNEDQILRLLAPRLGGVRVYTVGVDSAVNEGFLKRLAGLGGGACELVESEERLEEVLDRVHRRIGAPVLTDLELVPAGLRVDPGSLAPRRLPALFAGSPLVVGGRFAGRPAGAVTVRGRDAAGRPWSATVPATAGDGPSLTATWARAHLRDLEDRYATDPAPDRELERRIVDLSLRFGVLCRFTAFVAADVQVVNEGGVVHRVLQPVEAPAGWDMLRRVAAAMPLASLSAGGLQAAAGARVAAPRGGALAALDGRLGAAGGRAGPGRSARRRTGGFPAAPLGGADLAPYRRRAARLAALVEREQGDLGLVRVGLAALVADLESVDAVEQEIAPLRELAAELDRQAGAGVADGRELERLRLRALAVLRAFAAGDRGDPAPAPRPAGDPAPDPREAPARRRDPGFWRR